jgi:aspartyl-tRNA(Asn)/glutamyl-tRNA(Gln) amidotransferase subunit B
MEIVSKPDMRSAGGSAAYVTKLRTILRYLGTCDGNMEEGSLRADVNVSVRKARAMNLGTRCEIKNVNSMRFIRQAIEFEARRQIDISRMAAPSIRRRGSTIPSEGRDALDALQGRGA